MTNPVIGLFEQDDNQNPVLGLFEEEEGRGLKSAIGRKQYTARNIQENIAKLQATKAKAKDPAQQVRIDRLLAALQKQQGRFTRGVTEKRGAASNVGRGVAAGFGTTLPSLADLVLTIPDLMGFESADEARRWLAEQGEQVREYYDPQGKAGLTGEISGAIVAGAPGYGAAATGISKATGVSKALAGAKASANLGKRVAARTAENVVGGLPINLVQALGLKEATTEEKLKQFAIGTGADILFGAASGIRKPKGITADIETTKAPTAEPAKEAEAIAMVKKGQSLIDAKAEVDALVQARWTEAHPNVPWTALSAAAKKEFKKSIKDEIAAAIKDVTGLGKGDGGGEASGGTLAPKPPIDPTAPGGEVVKAPARIENPTKWLEDALGRKMTEAELKQIDERGAGGFIAFLEPVEQKKVLDAFAKNQTPDTVLEVKDPLYDEIKQEIIDKGKKLPAEQVNKPTDVREGAEQSIGSAGKEWTASDRVQRLQMMQDAGIDPERFGDWADVEWDDLTELLRQDLDYGGTGTKLQIGDRDLQSMNDYGNPEVQQWWDSLNDPEFQKKIVKDPKKFGQLKHLDQGSVRDAFEIVNDRHDLDELRNTIAKGFVDEEGNPTSLSPQDVWEVTGRGEKAAIFGDAVDIKYIMSDWEKLPSEIQQLFTRQLEDIQNPIPGANTKTVYEPSAAERLAADRVPDDVRAELVDLIIDAETEGWDQPTLLARLDDYAARNEVTREQVDQTLKDLGVGADTNLDKIVSPPLDALPGAPDPTLVIPDQAQLLSPRLEPSTAPSPTPTKVLADMSTEELDALKDQLGAAYEQTQDPAILAQWDEVAAESKLRASATAEGQAAIAAADKILPPVDPSNQIVRTPAAPVEEGPVRMDPAQFGKVARTNPAKLDDATLDAAIDETGWRIAELPEGENDVDKVLQDKLLAEKAKRKPPPPLDLQVPPGVGGFALGFTYGIATNDDEDGLGRALMWGAMGAAAAMGAQKAWNTWEMTKSVKSKTPELFPGEKSLPELIVYGADAGRKRTPMELARDYYTGMVRSSAAAESLVRKLGGKNLPAYQNFADMASIFGRWISKAEHWKTVRPVIDGPDGNPIYLDALPLAQIEKIAKGDIENLDKLAVAATTLENYGKPGWKPPMDIGRAQMTYANAPAHLHEAVKELRKYSLAMADALVDAGILSPSTRAAFATEAWYTPLHRVIQKVESEARKKASQTLGSLNPVKPRLGGSSLKVKSPYEVLNEVTQYYIKAAEYNKIKQSFVAFAKAQPPEVRTQLMRRIDKKTAPLLDQVQALSNEIKAEMPGISKGDADRLALALGKDLDEKQPIMTMYEDGVLRQYQVNPVVFDMFKHLMPNELAASLYVLGAPTRLAAKGIVNHPFFIGMMEFMNTFQSALQSRYGFVPFVDSFKGWWHAASYSPQYQKLLAAGGPATIQSLPYTQKGPSSALVSAGGSSSLERAANLIKEVHPWEAYKTLMYPVAEASRVGEALRALNHGESAVDAVYAAWHVTGNTRAEGHFALMRAFNLLTLFSRPAISAIDEAAAKAGISARQVKPSHSAAAQMLREMGMKSDKAINATEFWAKGFTYLGIPSMLLWYANQGDEEIQQLRQTSTGRKYWWARVNGQIMKIRKPHIIGQLFGSTLEDLLDAQAGNDPSSISWLQGMANDAAINLLPQVGVIPYGLFANTRPGLGIPIVPEADAGLVPELQGELEASNPARFVADKISPTSDAITDQSLMGAGKGLRTAMTPAGIDFVVTNTLGMLGQDALNTLDWFINEQRLDMPPTKDELPVVGRLFARYPQMNTKSVREFYNMAGKVEMFQNSFNELLTHKPQLAAQYQARHQQELMFADIFQQNRTTIANYRRQIEDLKYLLQSGSITHEEFRRVESEVLKRVIQIAQSTIQVTSPLQQP